MKIKKLSILLCGAALCIGLAVLCVQKSKKDARKKQVGIIQITEHDCLDQARKGFIDGLAESGYKSEENVQIDYQNAQGDQAVCNSIANTFAESKKRPDSCNIDPGSAGGCKCNKGNSGIGHSRHRR